MNLSYNISTNICVNGGLITIMKKILALSLAALMALSVMGCSKKDENTDEQDSGKNSQVVESTVTYENVTFGYAVGDDGYYEITSVEYDGIQKIDIKLPSEIDGMAVTGIATEAFKADTFIKSVEIPSSIKRIGDWAFYSCISIEKIKLPDSVTEIGKGAFWNCVGLSEITLSSAVVLIDAYAFMECSSLKAITIPESVKTIGEGAFYGCDSLEAVVIPASVETIGRGAFIYCDSLGVVTIENAKLVFPTNDDKKPEGVFVACKEGLEIKAAADSTAKAYVDAMNDGVAEANQIKFTPIVPSTAE